MIRFNNARGCFLGLLLILWLAVNAAVRTVLLVMAHGSLQDSFDWLTVTGIYFRGAVNDLFPYFLLTLPLMLVLLLKKSSGADGRDASSPLRRSGSTPAPFFSEPWQKPCSGTNSPAASTSSPWTISFIPRK